MNDLMQELEMAMAFEPEKWNYEWSERLSGVVGIANLYAIGTIGEKEMECAISAWESYEQWLNCDWTNPPNGV